MKKHKISSVPDDRAAIYVNVSESTHRRLKVFAAATGRTLQDVVEYAINFYLDALAVGDDNSVSDVDRAAARRFFDLQITD
jgi:hypothetical protein